ncbi:hypothetical protein B7755_023880 [Streptomyces sp. NBS 14/10]|uniref:hypothetical protein n=1 Tax=Streptomyces sp. NBS 14/10 TaxID=1945643 RepID=UPI000B7D750E|nr:hypothetical protein [Streptomyces sp. NBS 14/10]KAK1180915.1 hypothetical protein B7755_023880 [Streptomyces sp. NBS 14/10]NUS89814.1 hypothetical protein [Streptomyces sp.]
MSHRTTLRHARKAAAAMLIAVAAFGLTACQDGDTGNSSSPSASASAPQSPGTPSGTPSGTPKKPDTKCTDQINYAGDPRSNADINSIGEETGYCPPVQPQ